MTSNMAAALAATGYRVLQIGCDPKADSTVNLLNGKSKISVLEYFRKKEEALTLEDIVVEGFAGVPCVEAGGPTHAIGCAGRGIVTAMNVLEELEIFERYQPDIVFYDILGDVVCGRFAAPIRDGYADEVVIVTSGEKMSLFAAKNIYEAVENFKDLGYASIKEVILNRRNVKGEEEIVKNFARERGIELLGDIS